MGFLSRFFEKKEEETISFNTAEPILQELFLRNSITVSDFNYYNSPIVGTKEMYEDLLYDGRISIYDIPELYREEVRSKVEGTVNHLELEEQEEQEEIHHHEHDDDKVEEQESQWIVIPHTPEWEAPTYVHPDDDDDNNS